MIFQTIDDKTECIGVYADGKLHFDDIPGGLTRTWRYTGSIVDPQVEYAWIYCGGASLEDVAPEELKEELEAAEKKMYAYRRSFEIAKLKLNEHCVFDLVPHDFLMNFCEIKNKITKHVFENYERPLNYEFMVDVHKLIHKISYQELNLDLASCKHLMYSSMGRQTVKELVNNYKFIKYNPYGTVTGRLTTKPTSFPILTVKKEFRELLKPRNDLFVSLDYNGAEIRTFFSLCGSEQPKEDIHTWNIENIFKDEDMTRDEAKTLFFAWLYNPESDQIENEMYNRKKLLDNCYENGYINTPYGRNIKVDERKALNYLIQSTTADRVLQKAVFIDRMLDGKKSFISHIVHDEIVIDYHDEDRSMLENIRQVFEDGYLSNIQAGKDYYNLNKLEI